MPAVRERGVAMTVSEQMKQKATEYLRKQGIEVEKLRREHEESEKRLADNRERVGAVRELGAYLPIGPDLYGHAVAAVQQLAASFVVQPPGGNPPRWNEGELALVQVRVTNGSRLIMRDVVLDVVSKNPTAAVLWHMFGFGATRHLGTLYPGATRTELYFAFAKAAAEGQIASFGATLSAEPDLFVRAAEQTGGSTEIIGQ